MDEEHQKSPYSVAALYKFVRLEGVAGLPDYTEMQGPLLTACKKLGVLGTILLAREGINGTVCGSHNAIAALMAHLATDPRLADIQAKYSTADAPAFHRMKVRLKREIVTMGQPDLLAHTNPMEATGTYVKPCDWNALIEDPDTLVIDTRNAYEVAIGTFDGAVDPKTESFRAFPEWVDSYLAQLPEKPKNIAMFCTGGIRCEKSTAYLVGQGFQNIFHLEGGILKYLEEVPPEESKWQGDCFVFDQRVSVRHGAAGGLQPGDYDMCHACRMPLTEADKQHASFEAGVACLHCIDTHSEADRARFRERQKQIKLAKSRGEKHIGEAE
ncbi:MAG: rhodanese-related sulfurtransferase [PS1 clade bacterium]|uniref:tRNA uridine(34) hydroxylase n=1 Tax=PS1 clade bacterium TaxID=2175152 RepID=A0A937HJQ9_9PROT|nr:rhodanese-related sulfurtransferase [PS1 clade bacterium]